VDALPHESFGNDKAADFAIEMAESRDLSVVEQGLDGVIQAGTGDL
jgi:hypothetical protein